MNVDKMRRFSLGGDEAAIERAESLAGFHGTVGRRTMTKGQKRRHERVMRVFAAHPDREDLEAALAQLSKQDRRAS